MIDPTPGTGFTPDRRRGDRRQIIPAAALLPGPLGYERRASAVSDPGTSSALRKPIWSDQSSNRAQQLVTALAHLLTRTPGATVLVPRHLAELVHDELQRLTRGLWSAQDVARFLGVHRNWVYLQAEAGSLPCVRIGGLVRFEPEIIHAIARGEQVKGGRVIAVPVARKRSDRK